MDAGLAAVIAAVIGAAGGIVVVIVQQVASFRSENREDHAKDEEFPTGRFPLPDARFLAAYWKQPSKRPSVRSPPSSTPPTGTCC